MFEDPQDPPASSDPPPGGSGSGGGINVNQQDSIQGYTVTDESDSIQQSGSTGTVPINGSDPPPGGSGSGGG